VWPADLKRHLKSKHGQQKSTLKQQQPYTLTPEQQPYTFTPEQQQQQPYTFIFRPLGIHLMRQGHDLRYVSRVFEDDHVMGIETYGSMVFSSMKHILNDVHDTDVSVVTLLRKQRSYSLIRFVHEIV
jgi:hypothetical protein